VTKVAVGVEVLDVVVMIRRFRILGGEFSSLNINCLVVLEVEVADVSVGVEVTEVSVGSKGMASIRSVLRFCNTLVHCLLALEDLCNLLLNINSNERTNKE
jgi:hypothetical protein